MLAFAMTNFATKRHARQQVVSGQFQVATTALVKDLAVMAAPGRIDLAVTGVSVVAGELAFPLMPQCKWQGPQHLCL